MKTAFSTLRDSLGTIWDGVKSKIASPVRFVVNTVYNNGIRKMWNSIAGKISSKITLPSISLGFNKGGVVPGSGNRDTVPAMLTPGERILSNSQVAKLGGHRGIDAMLGQDRPTKTGGNPSQQERKDGTSRTRLRRRRDHRHRHGRDRRRHQLRRLLDERPRPRRAQGGCAEGPQRSRPAAHRPDPEQRHRQPHARPRQQGRRWDARLVRQRGQEGVGGSQCSGPCRG